MVELSFHAEVLQKPCCILYSCASQAAECLQKGQDKFNGGDRMGALKLFDQALQKVLDAHLMF